MPTATPLSVPLHFSSSSSLPCSGPTLPKDWRYKWHRSDYPRPREHRAEVQPGQDDGDGEDDEEWPDDDLKRWVTCMAVWHDSGSRGSAGEEGNHRTSIANKSTAGPRISVADENGENIRLDPDMAGDEKTPLARSEGDQKRGVRIALGLQNGTVWLFQKRNVERSSSSPQTPLEAVHRTRSPSWNSMGSGIPVSPSHTSNGGDKDGVGSPIAALAGTSEVNAVGSSVRNTGSTDAEERLETQWHAGRENHTVVGGMMEALGLNHSGPHHAHPHSHSHTNSQPNSNSQSHSGDSTPPTPGTPGTPGQTRRTPKEARKTSRASLMNFPVSPNGRSRTASVATTAEQSDRESITEHEGSERARLSSLMGATTGASRQRATSRAEESAKQAGEPSTAVVEGVEVLAALQCPSSSPLMSMARITQDRLATLQEDGHFTVWSLSDATQTCTLNLKTVKTPAPENSTSLSVSSTLPTHSSHLFSLAGLRSGANTPVPRSRVNSNATQPGKPAAVVDILHGSSRLHSMQLAKASEQSRKPIFVCFDDVKRRIIVVDAGEGKAVATHVLPDCHPSVPPVARVIGEEDNVDVYFVTTKNSITLHTLRCAPQAAPENPVEQAKASHLSSASVFLRREGLSTSNSKAPSIAEEKEGEMQDLGNGGLHEPVDELELLGDDLLVALTRSSLQVLRRVADSLVVIASTQVDRPVHMVLNQGWLTLQCEAGTALYRVGPSSTLQLVSHSPNVKGGGVQAVSTLASRAYRCTLAENGHLHLECNGSNIWTSAGPLRERSPIITASLPFSMERVVLSLCEWPRKRRPRDTPADQSLCQHPAILSWRHSPSWCRESCPRPPPRRRTTRAMLHCFDWWSIHGQWLGTSWAGQKKAMSSSGMQRRSGSSRSGPC